MNPNTTFALTHVDPGDIFCIQDTWWLEQIQHQGKAAFNPNPAGYKVFRNVKDYGARGKSTRPSSPPPRYLLCLLTIGGGMDPGDGATDDTDAINAAIADGNRCGNGCDSSTVHPALVYFPSGTYRISRPIVAWYYSQLVGHPTNRPVIKALPNFVGIALIDSDPYNSDGSNWYTNQNNFFRAIRNMVLDTTAQPPSTGTGLHWQVAQATSLINIKFVSSQVPGNRHQGIFMDNGSGGFMSDLEFVGGKFGAFLGNQQFVTRNLKFSNCETAIYVNWDWQWTFKSLDIDNCVVGVDFSGVNNGALTVGSVIILDSSIINTRIGIKTARTAQAPTNPTSANSAVLDNVRFVGVGQAVASNTGETILAGGTRHVDLWGQARTYMPNGSVRVVQAALPRSFPKPAALLDGANILERSRPQYQDVPAANFISVRSRGARGDGRTDDTAALRSIFRTFGGNPKYVIFFDHGVYKVSDTIQIPADTRIVGEVWAVIMADGAAFQDRHNPKPVWRVGNPGDVGCVELSDLLFQTRGPQPGAILLQWHSRDPPDHPGANGIWDVHFRVAGSRGTELEVAQCLKTPNLTVHPDPRCEGSFMHLHIAKTASIYIENCWAWTADHSLDRPFDQITVYNGRGIYDESAEGPVWMYGAAAEHNVLYQYQLANAKNVFMAMMQSETPYFQANPGANVPFDSLSQWNDPSYAHCTTAACRKAWALRIVDSSYVLIYGAGLYSFFDNYSLGMIFALVCFCLLM